MSLQVSYGEPDVGLTLGFPPIVTPVENARGIYGFVPQYSDTLQSALDGVASQQDLLNTLNIIWTPLGSGKLETTDSDYPIRGLTDEYYCYKIVITGPRVDADSTGLTWYTSTDNGIPWQTSSDYSTITWRQSSTSFVDNISTSANGIEANFNVRWLASDTTGYIEHWIFHPMNPDLLTTGHVNTISHEVAGTTTRWQQSDVAWKARALEKHDAVMLRVGSAQDFTDGQVQVWGLAAGGTDG